MVGLSGFMNYKTTDKEISISIPVANSGKFRFKTRKDSLSFGKSFATRSNIFNKDVYLEWQIGYDATEKDLKEKRKHTNLNKLTFTGYNKKQKYPYELSELIYEVIKIGLISIDVLKKLGDELENYKEFLSDKEIDVSHKGTFNINGISFEETVIQLPTFFIGGFKDRTQIEVSIQKQQYATGVQPMLYFSIPISSFADGSKFYGKNSKVGDKLVYIIDKNNVEVLLLMFKIFGMASPAHNHDIREILKVLVSLLK